MATYHRGREDDCASQRRVEPDDPCLDVVRRFGDEECAVWPVRGVTDPRDDEDYGEPASAGPSSKSRAIWTTRPASPRTSIAWAWVNRVGIESPDDEVQRPKIPRLRQEQTLGVPTQLLGADRPRVGERNAKEKQGSA